MGWVVDLGVVYAIDLSGNIQAQAKVVSIICVFEFDSAALPVSEGSIHDVVAVGVG